MYGHGFVYICVCIYVFIYVFTYKTYIYIYGIQPANDAGEVFKYLVVCLCQDS